MLKTITDNAIIYSDVKDVISAINGLQDLKDASDGEIPNIIQAIKVEGIIFDNNEYSDDLGKVDIDETFIVNDEEEYRVTHNHFLVKLIDDELSAIERIGGKEVYNPFDQEILNAIIPAKEEYESLIQFIKDVIKNGEIEFGEDDLPKLT
ncbi:MAG: hypothetical protein RXR17_09200 [Sulfolobaceae archaeon]